MIKYLSVDNVIYIHDQIEPWPVINQPALESAVYQPRQQPWGQEVYPTLVLKAAVLFRGLAYNHPFENANKRTAWNSAAIFLRINQSPLEDIEDLVAADFVTDAVAQNMSVEEISSWLTARLL